MENPICWNILLYSEVVSIARLPKVAVFSSGFLRCQPLWNLPFSFVTDFRGSGITTASVPAVNEDQRCHWIIGIVPKTLVAHRDVQRMLEHIPENTAH